MSDKQMEELRFTPEELKRLERFTGDTSKPWCQNLDKMYLRQTEKAPDAITLMEKCLEYFDYIHREPLYEGKLVTFEGVSTVEQVPKMRTATIMGLCAFLTIHRDTWGSWRRGDVRPELQPVVHWVEDVINDLKFTGAAAGLLNANLIARDLGLVDKQQVDTKTTVVIDGDEAEL